MPIASNATANMSRRQAFNGKGLTFVEVIFAQSMTATATTPDTKDSDFQKVSEVVREKGNLLAQSYRLAAQATDNDAAEATGITANNSIDSYQFIYEGTPGQHNTADSVGDINLDPGQNETSAPAVIADAEADIEAEIRSRLSGDSSNNDLQVKVRFLPADGVVSTGIDAVYGMFDQRGDA